MTITAFIPMYKQPRRAVDIARKLSAEAYPGARIVLVVDGDSGGELGEALDKARELPSLSVIEGRPHLGKAAALNLAVGASDADAFLFLDNDIDLPAASRVFARAAAILAGCDIAELPKVGRGKGFIAAMGSYEFLSNVIATEYLVNRTGRMPSINGAAFVTKRSLFIELGGFRPVINEDMDFAARAFLTGSHFGFDPGMTVGNEVPETAEEWFRQRRRWSMNSALWSTTYIEKIMRQDPSLRPSLGVSALIFPLPFLALLLGTILPWLGADILRVGGPGAAIAALLGAFLFFAPVALFYARKAAVYGSRFDLPTFFVFALVYLPVWGLASFSGMLNVAAGKMPDLGWKHGTGPEDDPSPRA